MKVMLAKIDLSGLPDVIEKANKTNVTNEKRRFYDTTKNWENKPSFSHQSYPSGAGFDDYKVTVSEDEAGKIWGWVNYGTEPHIIEPKGEGYSLVFQRNYSPKTSYGKIISNGSGERSGPYVTPSFVEQNIEPRDFIGSIKKGSLGRWERAITKEIGIYLKANA